MPTAFQGARNDACCMRGAAGAGAKKEKKYGTLKQRVPSQGERFSIMYSEQCTYNT